MAVDTIVLAGTRKGARHLTIDGESIPKQYAPLAGKTLLEWELESLVRCPEISRIYLPGDYEKNEKLLRWGGLGNYITEEKIILVPQQDIMMDNLMNTFFSYLLPDFTGDFRNSADVKKYIKRNKNQEILEKKVLILPSDAPLITPPEISAFLESSREESDLVVGFGQEQALKRLFDHLGEEFSPAKIKMNTFPIDQKKIRPDNKYLVKPLKIYFLYELCQELFENREVISKYGGRNKDRWQQIAKSLFGYIRKRKGLKPKYNVWRGIFNTLITGGLLYHACRKGKKQAFPRKSLFLRPKEFEKITYLLTGSRCQMVIHDHVGSMLDIDNQEMYQLLKEDKVWAKAVAYVRYPRPFSSIPMEKNQLSRKAL